MRRFLESPKSIPILFATITVLAYGLLLPLMGFYWDDWPFAWIAKFLGPAEFIPAFWRLRPFLGPIFFVTTSLIPTVPIYWQIFALLIRFISGLSAWFALNQIFPRHKRQALIASLLFLVFPGYSQQWVALTHVNQEWIPFIFYLLSFGFTASALRKTGKFRSLTLYALLCLIAGVFPTEYFIGLEPLRLLFIWVIVSEGVNGFRHRLNQTLKYWSPYLLIWLGNAAWLAYYYTSGIYISYNVEVIKEPLTINQIFLAMGEVIWKGGLYIWGQVFVLITTALTAPTSLLTLVLIAVTFGFLLVYLTKLNMPVGEAKPFAVSAILIGVAGMLLGRVPSFAAGLPLTLQSSYDRFMISIMLGGTLFITGLIELLIGNVRVKAAVFALLIASGIGQQFFNANIFRRDWAKQQEIYWQLAWRIPAMQSGTLLLTDKMPFDYETDNSFTAPINWMYAPNYEGGDLPYLLLYTEIRLGGPTLPALGPNMKIHYSYRTVSFNGSTSQAIVLYMPQNGCLRVLDPALGDADIYGRQSRDLMSAIRLSDPSLIISEGISATPAFSPEPPHGWCYYYAKAELARQMKDWRQIMALQTEVIKDGYVPEDPFEWSPFIEANAMIGNFDRAEQTSMDAIADEPHVRKEVCAVWKRVQAQGPVGGGAELRIVQALSIFQCAR